MINKPLTRKQQRELDDLINDNISCTKRPKRQKYISNSHLERTYGITIEEKQQLVESQHHCCLICFKDISTNGVVDHCHTTGKVRGVLCSQCNLLLGMAKDNQQILLNAVEYLKASKM